MPQRGREREREKEKQHTHIAGGGWRRRAHTCGEERKREHFGSSFYTSFPCPGPAVCKLGQPRVLFVLPEVLTPVLGPSFDLPLFYFHGLSPSLSFQFSSATQSCPTLCDPMNCSTPGLPVHQQLPEFTQTHVHQVSDAIQPSHPLLSPSPPAPNLSLLASGSFPMSQLFA